MELQRQSREPLLGKKKRRAGFKLQGKNFFLTYPQCDLSREEAFSCLSNIVDVDYILIALESHKDGTPHLHVLLTVKSKLHIYNAKFFDIRSFHGNYQTAKKTDDVRNYILKSDDNPFEMGLYQSNHQSKVQKRAIENKTIIDTPLHTLVDEGTISIYNYSKLKSAKDDYLMSKLVVNPIMEERESMWIVGDPGCGKTYWVRINFPECFVKSQNKWWDGYIGQDVVLMDDFDCSMLGHNIKIWADKYSFNAEIKGGTVKPVYTKFIVTSNYFPEQIWKEDNVLAAAVTRRFKFYTVVNRELRVWGMHS